jgi:thiol:disulfide interchange protein
MRTLKSIIVITALTVLISASAMSQTVPKVIAVVNKADWCPVCKANGERAMAAFMKNNEDGLIRFLAYDVTNDQTKKNSAEELKKFGIDQIIDKYQGTGLVSFFNPETKQLISQVSVSESDNKLADAMKAAKSKVN